MRFQIIISTMNNGFHKRNVEVKAPLLIINQSTEKDKSVQADDTLNMNTLGLSKSRNFGLKNSCAEICLISDDDLLYLPDIDVKITEVFDKYTDVDIVTFCMLDANLVHKKKYSDKPFYHNMRTLMRVSSVEIAVRRDILNDNLSFDEKFGLGARFPTGEEVIFLTDAFKMGKKILFYPLDIVIHPEESSGSNYSQDNLAKAKGAMFYRIFKWKAYFLCLLFALKHYKKTPYSLLQFIRELFAGIAEYKVEIK